MARPLWAAALAVSLLVRTAAGQDAAAGPWLPLDSRLDRLVSWSIQNGALKDVDPLTRPYRIAAVRRAVADQDTLPLSRSARRALGWLREELDTVRDTIAAAAEIGETAFNNGRRDTFRAGGSSGTGAMGGIWVSMANGPLVLVVNPAFDNRLKHDPEFTGFTDRFIAGRLQSGYVAVTGRRGDVLFGRTARNWGPDQFDGLQLSPSAYATDQIAGTVRLGRLELTTLAQRLDDYDTTLSAATTRWFFAHRLTVRAGRGVWLAFSETGVYGGPGRGFEPAFHAPLNLALLSEYNDHLPVNVLLGLELHAPLGHGLTLAAQGVIDDLQVDRTELTDHRPGSGGFTMLISQALAAQPVHVSLGYTRVRSLTYRNSFNPWTTYAVRGVGIGRNFADYDQTVLRIAARPAAAWSAALDVSYLRQGSGDFRQPFPPDSVLAQPGQGFLLAPVRSATAVRLVAAAQLRSGIQVDGAVGINNAATGAARRIASIGVRVRFDVLARRIGGGWGALESGLATLP